MREACDEVTAGNAAIGVSGLSLPVGLLDSDVTESGSLVDSIYFWQQLGKHQQKSRECDGQATLPGRPTCVVKRKYASQSYVSSKTVSNSKSHARKRRRSKQEEELTSNTSERKRSAEELSATSEVIIVRDAHHLYDEVVLANTPIPNNGITVLSKSIHREDAAAKHNTLGPGPSRIDPKLMWEYFKRGDASKEESRSSAWIVKKKYAPIATPCDNDLRCNAKKMKKKRTNSIPIVASVSLTNESADCLDTSCNISSKEDRSRGSIGSICDNNTGRKSCKKQRRNKSVKRRKRREGIEATAAAAYAAIATILCVHSISNHPSQEHKDGGSSSSSSEKLKNQWGSDFDVLRDTVEISHNSTRMNSYDLAFGLGELGSHRSTERDVESGRELDQVILISDYDSLQCTVLDCGHGPGPGWAPGPIEVKRERRGQQDRFLVLGVPPGCTHRREREYWLAWCDIAEVVLLSPRPSLCIRSEMPLSLSHLESINPPAEAQALSSDAAARGVDMEKGNLVGEVNLLRNVDSDHVPVPGVASDLAPYLSGSIVGMVPIVEENKTIILPAFGPVSDIAINSRVYVKKRRKKGTSTANLLQSISDGFADDLVSIADDPSARSEGGRDLGSYSRAGSLSATATAAVNMWGCSDDTISCITHQHHQQDDDSYQTSEATERGKVLMAVDVEVVSLMAPPPQLQSMTLLDDDDDKPEMAAGFPLSFADLFGDILTKKRVEMSDEKPCP